MSEMPDGAAELRFDGERLPQNGGGRSFQVDARCLGDDPIRGAYAHVCALTDPAVAPPAGPVVERYAGVAWPGGSFTPRPHADGRGTAKRSRPRPESLQSRAG